MIRRYGTQSVRKVGLNQPIMREVLEKLMSSIESRMPIDIKNAKYLIVASSDYLYTP